MPSLGMLRTRTPKAERACHSLSSEVLRPHWPGPLDEKHTIAGEALDMILATDEERITLGMAKLLGHAHERPAQLLEWRRLDHSHKGKIHVSI